MPSAVALHGSGVRAAAVASFTCAGLAAAVELRVLTGGYSPAGSMPAAAVFVAVLAALLAASQWRPERPTAVTLLAGLAGGLALVVLPLTAKGYFAIHPQGAIGPLAGWLAMVVAVAVTEEAVLRGLLFKALQECSGSGTALVVTTLVFALIHLPLYGMAALPLDLAVGLWLGGLRLATGGMVAPAVAHALADISAGWLL